MEKSFDQLVEYYFEKKKQGMDFQTMRRELRDTNVDEALLERVILRVDDLILNHDMKNANRSRSNELKIAGYIFAVGGLILTGGTMLGFIDLNGYYIVAFGPVVAGSAMIVTANRMKVRSRSRSSRTSFFQSHHNLRR